MRGMKTVALLYFAFASGAVFAQAGQSGNLQELEDALTEEILARQQADAVLQANIDAEVAARISADAGLASQLDNEVLLRTIAINAEQNERQAADQSLQGSIDDEVAARNVADLTLQSNLDTEASARLIGDVELINQLDNEKALRIAAINAEQSARAAADQSLQNSIDLLESQIDALPGAGMGNVVSGFALVPNGTDPGTSTDIFVAGVDGLVLTDACAGVNNGGWAFSGNTVGEFMRVATDATCTSVQGIALPPGEIISCRPQFNSVSAGDAFCTVSGIE